MWNEHDTFTSRTCFGTRRPPGLQYSSGGPGTKYVTGDVSLAVVQHAPIVKARLYKSEQISDQETLTASGPYIAFWALSEENFRQCSISYSLLLAKEASFHQSELVSRGDAIPQCLVC